MLVLEGLPGHHPFAGETPISVVIKHINEPMPRPSEFNPAIPPALDEVVARATAKSPDERYQRAGELARALRAILASGAPPEFEAEWVTPSLTPPVATPPQTPIPASPAAGATPPPIARPWYRQPVAWVAMALILALAVAAVLVLPSLRSEDQEAELAGAVPTPQPGEVAILIAQFKATAGSESFDVSQRIYDKLLSDLRQLGETEVAIYQVPDVIESSAAAVALGRKYGATTVIWGYYDDIGISPNVEAVGALEDSPLSVGLERFNLDPDEAVNFRLYIAKDLPEELSFLTAVSLFQAFMLQGRLDKAMAYVVMAADNLPEDPQFRGGGEMVYFMQGMMDFYQGDLQGSVEKMGQAIAINSEETLFYTLRGTIYAQLGDAKRALSDVERAIALDPDNSSTYAIKAAVHWLLGDQDGALSAYEKMTELRPDDWMGHLGRAVIAFEMGDLTTALDAWDLVEEIDPENAFLPLHRGLVREKLGLKEQAAADYARAGEGDVEQDMVFQFMQVAMSESMETSLPVYFLLTDCAAFQVRGDVAGALALCSEALEIDPTYADALWKRGQLYAAQGDWEAAIADYTAAIQADPSWPWFYYLRAQALTELGRAEEAQADLARALELDPVDELRQQIEALREEGS